MAKTPPAIFHATTNARTREAMLLGSGLEGGWASPYPVGDQGTSFGPYQLHDGRGGLNQAQAENPTMATHVMLPSYEDAVNQISDKEWDDDPENAAEQAAQIAEAPAQSYYAAQGRPKVNEVWANTRKQMAHGGHSTAGMPPNAQLTSAGGGVGGALGLIPGGSVLQFLLGLLTKGASGEAGSIGSGFAKDFERIGLVIFGGLLVLVGLIILAMPAAQKTIGTAANIRTKGATAGLVSRAGASANQADMQRRQDIANRSLAIGEQKVAIQQQRENRLAR